MLHLRGSEREADEDKVTDVMDFIVGWCSPHQCLFPAYLTNEEIEKYNKSKPNPHQSGKTCEPNRPTLS